jgi:hypothetical protein
MYFYCIVLHLVADATQCTWGMEPSENPRDGSQCVWHLGVVTRLGARCDTGSFGNRFIFYVCRPSSGKSFSDGTRNLNGVMVECEVSSEMQVSVLARSLRRRQTPTHRHDL